MAIAQESEPPRTLTPGKGSDLKLARKVKDGGAGTWGNVPMPPNAAIPETDLGEIVAWILRQR